MNFLSTHKLHSEDMKVFLTNEDGQVHLLPKPLEVQWQTTTEYIDILPTISEYDNTPRRLPIKKRTNIQITTYLDREFEMLPDTGIINVAQGEYSYSVKYWLEGWSSERFGLPTDLITISLLGMGEFLEGEHAPKLFVVRFDLGDGTYKEIYTHEKESGLAVERYYNRVNLWK